MKFLNVLIVFGLMVSNASALQITEEEYVDTTREVNVVPDIHSVAFPDYNSDVYSFTPGDSNSILARLAREAEEARILAEASPTNSYSGTGTAKVIGTTWEQCIPYAKRKTGISRSLGYAGSTPIQGTEAKVGSIALEWNHASYVVEVKADSIVVTEANYYRGKETRREIPLNRVRGYVYT